jgi:hypothetical protein
MLQARGCRLTPHFTGAEKVDPDFGVMSLAPLFESTGTPPLKGNGPWQRVDEGDLIELPDDRTAAWVGQLVGQLVAWEQSGLSVSQKTDLVMALWFCDLAFKRILDKSRGAKSTHMSNPWIPQDRARERGTVNLADLRYAMLDEKAGV